MIVIVFNMSLSQNSKKTQMFMNIFIVNHVCYKSIVKFHHFFTYNLSLINSKYNSLHLCALSSTSALTVAHNLLLKAFSIPYPPPARLNVPVTLHSLTLLIPPARSSSNAALHPPHPLHLHSSCSHLCSPEPLRPQSFLCVSSSPSVH